MGTTGGGKRFPLWRHKATKQWTKKIRGRFHYFGTDKAKALERYERERKDLEAGRTPPAAPGTLTVRDLANGFLTAKRQRVDSGELTPGMWGEYFHALEQVLETFGPDRAVTELRPDDFGRLRAAAAKRLGPAAIAKFVTMVRTLFAFAYKSELIAVPVRYGDRFDKPPRRVMRLEKARKGPKLIDAADARKLIDAADVQLRAMILLGLNAAYGATDCSNLQRRSLERQPGWIDAPRQKTGVVRRAALWPETVQALEAVARERPEPIDPADADCVFLTKYGNRWVRFADRGDTRGVRLDAVTHAFGKLLRTCGVKVPGGFGVLRHTFRTVADETKDQPACMIVMGHSDESINWHYRERVSDSRLRAVADHVRGWLFG